MPNPKGKITYHLIVDKEQKDLFEKNYPDLLRLFLNRCIKAANNRKDLFETIFFMEM